MKRWIIGSLFLLYYPAWGQQLSMEINENWEFSLADTTDFYPAKVPGDVHIDLMNNDLIPDPFKNSNEDSVQWIGNKDWIYRTNFLLDSQSLALKHLFLIFEGLDTYADVTLNGTNILSSNNMFVGHKIDIKPFVKANNQLEIYFHSPMDSARKLAAKNNIDLPTDNRVYIRKAQYQFGWDWGPELVGCGIWKQVRVEGYDLAKLMDISINTDSINEYGAFMRANISYDAMPKTGNTTELFEIECFINNNLVSKSTNLITTSAFDPLPIFFTISQPQLWWPTGYGEAHLYEATFYLLHDGKRIDSLNHTFGIRFSELVQDVDSVGTSFYLKINNQPVFAKGANFIPTHSFPGGQSSDDYRNQLQDVADAGVNMLRIWGGGIYEHDIFYELCDSLGIMVWQDFMFACAMYPGDDDFNNNVSSELIYQINRLKKHPSIVLWCGNNEIDEAWHNWGWQNKYNKTEAAQIWSDYESLFHGRIPETLALHDNTRPYWPSSPSIGWGRKESLASGDMHYWGVWWGKEPFSIYAKKTGRFMSEYGFQGMPDLATLREYIDSNKLNLNSPALKTHQKHPVGDETILEYMKRDFPVPESFEDYIYVSQLLQAWGMQQAFSAHIGALPYCMGTLFWQWNDCWPVTSWSAVDFRGRRKALYYSSKRYFNDAAVIGALKDGTYNINVVNTSPMGKCFLKVVSITKDESTTAVLIPIEARDRLQNELAFQLDKKQMARYKGVMVQLISESDGIVFSDVISWLSPKDLQLKPTKVNYHFDKEQRSLYITTDQLVWGLNIQSKEGPLQLSDNFINLAPGYTRVILVDQDIDPNSLVFRTLNDVKGR